jgi:hypothetical protein
VLIGDILRVVFDDEIRTWHGGRPLAPVFWLYGVAVSSIAVLRYAVALQYGQLRVQQALLLAFAAYTAWILVAVWRCAANAPPFWGALARWLTVAWAANAALVIGFLQIDLLTRCLGG